MPEGISAARVVCPHCREKVDLPRTAPPKPRWFYAREKKKYGPYSWQQLLTLAESGVLRPDDMLLQEGSRQWVRASTLRSLFAGASEATGIRAEAPAALAAPPPSPSVPVAKIAEGRSNPWLVVGLAGTGVSLVLGLVLIAGYFLYGRSTPTEEQQANQDKVVEPKKGETPPDTPGKQVDPPKQNGPPTKKEEKKKETKETKPRPAEPWAQRFVERLNQQRQAAGLGSVRIDDALSRGCQAHARYLALNLDPQSANAANVYTEDASKPGFSADGQRTAKTAMVALAEPLAGLDLWLGRLQGRLTLLNPEMRALGIGVERNAQGDWFCVLDPVRGNGDAVVLFPAPGQQAVPLAFSGGPEVPDAKTAGGFPITITFPPTQQVTDARIELHDEKGAAIAGWVWTPEKPVPRANQRNTIALIPKDLLKAKCIYQVQASAQVDGKAWTQTWSFTTEDDSDSDGSWAKKALAKVNAYRARANLPAVALDPQLSRGCLAHARYIVLNADHPALQGLGAHDEDPKLPGFSEAGRQAGKASDIAIGDYEPLDGVDAWMATLYHRVPILEPNLKTIGFGCARGRRLGWITVLNVVTGRDRRVRPHPVFYPAPDQTDVPLNFPNGGEEPNPIPDDKDGRAGYPITAFFPEKEPLKNAVGKLTTAQGDEVPCWMSSLEKPANPQFKPHQGNTFCLIPKEPLTANTTYHVQVQGQLASQPWTKRWKFTTGESGLSSTLAAKQVVERLNLARWQAGLGNVVLDPTQSRGCQLHAAYLAQNTDALKQKKASVNDEDPSLPGYTIEGAQAARQSDVFSNAPVPMTQIDDLMATFSRRVFLLDPTLQRVGVGCAHDVGRGWRCVLDLHGGKGDARIVLFPAPKQTDVPRTSSDQIAEAKDRSLGFPITVTFPRQAKVRNAQGVLSDASGKEVVAWLSSPEKALNGKTQPSTIALYPLMPLEPGQTYSVTMSAIVNAAEWRQTWQFTTAKSAR